MGMMRKSTTILTHFKSKINFSSSTPITPHQRNPNLSNLHHNRNAILTLLSSRCFSSTTTAHNRLTPNPFDDSNHEQVIDFPGGKVKFIPEMRFISESCQERIPCYRVLDDNGQPILGGNFVQVSEDVAVKMYNDMVTLQTMDTIFYEAQRQGRISFYVTTIGEEAINIASASALSMDDVIFPQYREQGVLLWRGFTLQEFANQCFSNKFDNGKGRQMPAHYGSKKHNYITVASTVATQIPHAVGAAYSLKMDKKDACAVTYFGDGGSSEGDFHAGLNFAAVLEAPVIFICRNNGWAISTPTSDQFRSDGIVAKGQAYGVRSIRVDGNDALAIYSAVQAARQMAVSEERPILIEALTYRVGHHSTSDDSTKYRPANEIEWWKLARDPVARFRKWIETNGWWNDMAESELRNSLRQQGGVILGPSVLGKNETFANAVFPLRSVMVIETMANVGLLYFLFLVGVEMDITVLRSVGKKAAASAIAGMVFPFIIGGAFSFLLNRQNDNDMNQGTYILFLGVALSVTAFPVLARILAELKLINTDLGKLALSAALINDVCAWILLALAIALAENEPTSLASLWVLLSSVAFVAFCIYAVRPAASWIIKKTPEGESFSEFYISLILAGVMVSGFITDAIGTHSVFGAFVFGLAIPNGPLGVTLVEKLEDFVSGLLLPLFFAISGLKTNIGLIKGSFTWAVLILVIFLACIGKVIGTLAVAIFYQMPVREGAALGLLMNTKGLVEMIVLNVGKDQKIFDEESFAVMVIITVIMTGIIVPAVSIIYRPSRRSIHYKRRTIQVSKPDAEFRVVVCVHSPRNVPTMINLLEASNPTKRSPICIYVLHLVELSGRTSAMLIVHNTSKPEHTALNRTEAQSDHIISAFKNYEQHASFVSVQPLTAISPYSTMHEDICNLAEDKRVSLIIIPFHKQQTVDGGMEATNMAFRTINQNVLANAPCSVGILVDRGLNGSNRLASNQVSHHVAILFFGGPDDREALCYGWRMLEHPGISLTIMRFVPGEQACEPVRQQHGFNSDEPSVLTVETDNDIQKQLDDKLIHEFRMRHGEDDSVDYFEKVVNNGEETVAAIRTMDDIHDLFIVGRGQGMISPLTAGLTDWSECPEMGAIGDLLASSDFAATASVLVVQQYVGAGSQGEGLETPNGEEYVTEIDHHSAPPRGHAVFNTERFGPYNS